MGRLFVAVAAVAALSGVTALRGAAQPSLTPPTRPTATLPQPTVPRQAGLQQAVVEQAAIEQAPIQHALPGGLAPPDPALWSDAPAYVALFAPPLHRDQYRAYVSPQPLDEVLRRLANDASLLHPPGSWTPRAAGVRQAFGESGVYNRFDLARLYVSTPVQVARGPRGDRGRVVESWMLFSPYPDRAMSVLERGTLLLVVPVPPL